MAIKKIIVGTGVCMGLLAATVPFSMTLAADCDNGCPLSKVTPKNATCDKCTKVYDECGCEQDLVTGGAASIDAKKYQVQKYSYPDAVYTNSNASAIGGVDNNAIMNHGSTTPCGKELGVMVTEGCPTGGAAMIDETGGAAMVAKEGKDCGCEPDVSVKSPTSIEVTRKVLEGHNPRNITGFAAGMGNFYPDVPDSHWASSDINRLTDKCVLYGYPNGLFKPNKDVTRAEMAQAIVKGYNLEGTQMTPEGNFSDVPKSHWAYEAINKGASADFLEGVTCDKFNPNGKITMAQALTIVSKGINCPMDKCKADEILTKYKDGHLVPDWAKIPVAKAIDNGALSDINSCYIHPNKEANRAQIATMLQNIRVAGGYDTDNQVASSEVKKTYVEKEQKVTIPTLELKMGDIINSKNANVGERFGATTLNTIVIDGVTFEKGSKVYGKVVEVIRPTKNSKGAIRLSFNQIEGCDGKKYDLPKQILTARVDKNKDVNGFTRAVQWPFTWTGSILGNVGRAAGGIVVGLANATENLLDSTGTGSAELLTGQFRASGRSYANAGKALVMAPIDVTRTAFSGTMGVFQTTVDEVAYLVDPSGMKVSQVNPKQKITIAFGK